MEEIWPLVYRQWGLQKTGMMTNVNKICFLLRIIYPLKLETKGTINRPKGHEKLWELHGTCWRKNAGLGSYLLLLKSSKSDRILTGIKMCESKFFPSTPLLPPLLFFFILFSFLFKFFLIFASVLLLTEQFYLHVFSFTSHSMK